MENNNILIVINRYVNNISKENMREKYLIAIMKPTTVRQKIPIYNTSIKISR